MIIIVVHILILFHNCCYEFLILKGKICIYTEKPCKSRCKTQFPQEKTTMREEMDYVLKITFSLKFLSLNGLVVSTVLSYISCTAIQSGTQVM